ncbi:MAG: hypothetical protein HY366_01690 [Candidatus Aenigmarchaeota archaeon]|nr:hypothetical protein [Candidatus Aenigmarchaeota archaeon]
MNIETSLSSRVRSKLGLAYLIENGLVRVNGRVVEDSTMVADGTDVVEIEDADPKLRLDAPDSYWRARVIQETVGFVSLGDSVLHIETRDGGFPMLVRDYSGQPFVVTSKRPPIEGTVIGTNPFSIKPGEVQAATRARVDVMVQELELDAIRCFQAVERLLPALRSRGKMMLFLPMQGRDAESLEEMARRFLGDMSVDVSHTFKFSEGIYVYGIRVTDVHRALT